MTEDLKSLFERFSAGVKIAKETQKAISEDKLRVEIKESGAATRKHLRQKMMGGDRKPRKRLFGNIFVDRK